MNIRYPIINLVDGKTSVTKGTFHNELKWTCSYFCNNLEPRLYEIVQNEFVTYYDPLEQAGPLFLKLLLGHLIFSNDANEAVFMSTVFNNNIKNNTKTEDIHKVIWVLSSITDNIVAIWDHKENPLPNEYLPHLTSIYQTTSVEKLNRTFAKLGMMLPTCITFVRLQRVWLCATTLLFSQALWPLR